MAHSFFPSKFIFGVARRQRLFCSVKEGGLGGCGPILGLGLIVCLLSAVLSTLVERAGITTIDLISPSNWRLGAGWPHDPKSQRPECLHVSGGRVRPNRLEERKKKQVGGDACETYYSTQE